MSVDISGYVEALELGGNAILDAAQKCEFENARLLCQSTTKLANCLSDIHRRATTCDIDEELLERVTARMEDIQKALVIMRTKRGQRAISGASSMD